MDKTDALPDVEQVSLLLRTRTVGMLQGGGGGLGGDTGPQDVTIFDDTTRPTATEVEKIVDSSYGAVMGMIDIPITQLPIEHAGSVQHAVSLYAAIMIEVSFFRETANQYLIDLWRDMLKDAVSGIKEEADTSGVRPGFGEITVGTLVTVPYVGEYDPVEGLDF